jgi:hypothetical protein
MPNTTYTWHIVQLERETADGLVITAHYTGSDYSQWLAASPAPAEDTLSFAGNSTTSGIA